MWSRERLGAILGLNRAGVENGVYQDPKEDPYDDVDAYPCLGDGRQFLNLFYEYLFQESVRNHVDQYAYSYRSEDMGNGN